MTTARRAYAALGLGLVLTLVYAAVLGSDVEPVLYLVVGGYGTLLSLVGALRAPPGRRRIWWAFVAAQVLFLVGDLLWTWDAEVLHVDRFPAPADVAYLAQYPVLALGMYWLIVGRQRGRDRAAFLDAAILTTGCAVVGIVFFVTPAAAAGGTTLAAQAVAAAYPVGDLLVLALVVRMFTSGDMRNVALWAVFGGMATVLVADLVYVVVLVQGLPYVAWIDVGYLLSYLLLGFAVLHPSARILTEPVLARPDTVPRVRLTLLGAALMMAPLTAQAAHIRGVDHGFWVVLVGGCIAAVLVVLRLGDVVQDLQRSAVQLAALARKDGLTGVPNRRSWDFELVQACARASDQGTPLTMALLDLDHFKVFNDTFGHVTGDLVLKETAAAWSSILEGRGLLARFGGEEFTVLLPVISAEESTLVLEQMRRAVAYNQTCSIGVATWDGLESPADLVARADRALYHAKDAGRDRISIDDGRGPKAVSRSIEDAELVSSLRTVYQPIVELSTGRVVGHEALSRFDGEAPHDVFARAARDGSSARLQAMAIRTALAGWDGGGLLALNASPDVLATPQLRAALPEDLTGIILEVTEEDVIDGRADTILAIERMRERGALIAIDDFGIGFSNLQRVVALQPDIVKLDMSLIRGIDTDPMLKAAVAAAQLFAKGTRSVVIAEGIETIEERDCLAGLGVAYGQGYLLGPPEALLTRSGPAADRAGRT